MIFRNVKRLVKREGHDWDIVVLNTKEKALNAALGVDARDWLRSIMDVAPGLTLPELQEAIRKDRQRLSTQCALVEINQVANINNSAQPQTLTFGDVTLGSIDDMVVNADNIDLPDGMYHITALLNFRGNAPRVNFDTLFLLDGAVVRELDGHNYIRSTNGNNKGSQAHPDLIEVNGNSPFQIQTRREGNSSATQLHGTSRIIIEKVE